LILRRFLRRRLASQSLRRAIFYDFKGISQQKQLLGCIFDSIWRLEIAQQAARAGRQRKPAIDAFIDNSIEIPPYAARVDTPAACAPLGW
jgi:hypothetical protein